VRLVSRRRRQRRHGTRLAPRDIRLPRYLNNVMAERHG
jgi:hypothetical protein